MEDKLIERTVSTYWVEICIGFRKEYSAYVHDISELTGEIENWLVDNPSCVTVTPTTFYYRHGWEPGAIIRMINYPRFPKEPVKILGEAKSLAECLKKKLDQIRVSLVTPTETIMLSSDPADVKTQS